MAEEKSVQVLASVKEKVFSSITSGNLITILAHKNYGVSCITHAIATSADFKSMIRFIPRKVEQEQCPLSSLPYEVRALQCDPKAVAKLYSAPEPHKTLVVFYWCRLAEIDYPISLFRSLVKKAPKNNITTIIVESPRTDLELYTSLADVQMELQKDYTFKLMAYGHDNASFNLRDLES